MKTLCIFFSGKELGDAPLDKKIYDTAYRQLGTIVAQHGAKMVIVRGQESYKGGNTFAGGWTFNGKEYQRFEEDVVADIIFNRSNFLADTNANVVNTREFDDLCTNKMKTYEEFSDFSPHTGTAHSKEEAEKILSTLKTPKIVAKPLDEAEGKGVKILPRDEILAAIPRYPYLLQEFIDTSKGIPGLTNTVHDLRIISIGGAFVVSYLRTAPKGSLLANVAQGGTIKEVIRENVPSGAMELFQKVDSELQEFPHRLYSVDMARDERGKWWLIELNSKPGLNPLEQDPGAGRYMEAIADLLCSLSA